jgi:hypothetical protein
MRKRKKSNSRDFAANSKRQPTEQEVKFDFVRWIASELRAQVADSTLVLQRSNPFGHSNQRSRP